MEAKDLRMGNDVDFIVQKLSFCNGKITQIGKTNVWVNEIKMLYSHLNPIPLTEEWLLKFGFSDSEYKTGYTGKEFTSNMILDFVLTNPGFMGEWQKNYVFELRNSRIVGVEYIHQLQNLYFTLTGEELEIKEVDPNS